MSSTLKKIKKDVWDFSVKPEENLYYWNQQPLIAKSNNLDLKKPLAVELFCGCGGTSLGFEMAGFEIALGNDIHKPSILTFKYNHPKSATILGDINKVKPNMIIDAIGSNKVDVLIAGVPCQGFSLNNRKRHSKDERNYLYVEFVRMIEALKPRAIVLENVSGMKSAGNGEFIDLIKNDLSKASGMKVYSKMLCAADYGVPQNRNRLLFVGVKNHNFDFNEINKTHGPDLSKKYISIKDAIGDLPSLSAGESKDYYGVDPFSDYQKLMRRKSNNTLSNHVAPKHPIGTIEKIKNTKPGEPMYERFKQRIRLSWDIQSPTQVSGGIRPQFQFGHPSDSRGLTLRERCRLQSFPDHFIIQGGTVQGRVQTGNAVPPLLAKTVALAIKKYL